MRAQVLNWAKYRILSTNLSESKGVYMIRCLYENEVGGSLWGSLSPPARSFDTSTLLLLGVFIRTNILEGAFG